MEKLVTFTISSRPKLTTQIGVKYLLFSYVC
jgi:hypothetical protein